ncbi:TPA: hypothetical protein MJE48_18600 [Klebsiella pneumoniae]|uniref:hypothetical protein n=1 Tax=Klebsiella pneumoniae complex TaxID=3390273 RepID=UPI001BDB0BDA|nr:MULTISPECIES: hypothetical protein [Klebsiella]HBW7200658.1 hypothetical protein [Klebsiella pneumoniae]MBT0597396.1 hypothetical protein [Klebsiella quasipneumoniae]MDG0494783.1 hypothetical protein [Klebsiella variicola]HBZ1241907.1 hypothetical protein [Klebsiella pneumoniae]HEL9797220.1 hypothetical protein [Klebsiella pneumoniae]
MTAIKSIFLSTALLVSFSALASDADISTLKKELKVFQPTDITKKNNDITVVISAKNITREAYEAIITNGLCTPIWTKDTPSSFLNGINTFTVVNQFKAFGYTLDSPLSTCKEMGNLMPEPAKVLMYSKTKSYTSS